MAQVNSDEIFSRHLRAGCSTSRVFIIAFARTPGVLLLVGASESQLSSNKSSGGLVVMDRLALMETFVRVLETGSLSAAARHLNVGQSAVSKSVAQLEDRLGVRLLMRSTHSLTPTEAGQIYYERACRVIDEAHEADLDADFVRDA